MESNNTQNTDNGKRLPRVYISGPIAHYDLQERMQAFKKAEQLLDAYGFTPINPFNNGVPQEASWRCHMKADIQLLLTCDFIYFLPEWHLSKGCRLELDVAASCGVQVLSFHNFGQDK